MIAFSTTHDLSIASVDDPSPSPESSSPEPRPTPILRVDTPRRTYVICLDVLHSAFPNFVRIRTALSKFFQQEESADSQYALIALGREPKIIVDSTRDPSVVLAAIQSKKLSATILDSEASSKGMIAREFERLMKEYCSKCACGGATADGPACTGIKARVSGFLLNFRQRTSVSDLNFLLSTNRLVEAITNMPTTRTIIFISDGFNRFAGSELHGIMQGYAPRDHGLVFNPEDTQPQLERVIKLAVRYDVKFYTLDSRELYTSASLAGSNFDASNGPPLPEAVDQQILSSSWQNGGTLAQLARETGG